MKNSIKILQHEGIIPIFRCSIASSSVLHLRHVVSYYRDKKGKERWECDCLGFLTHGHCHHIDEAKRVLYKHLQNKYNEKFKEFN